MTHVNVKRIPSTHLRCFIEPTIRHTSNWESKLDRRCATFLGQREALERDDESSLWILSYLPLEMRLKERKSQFRKWKESKAAMRRRTPRTAVEADHTRR